MKKKNIVDEYLNSLLQEFDPITTAATAASGIKLMWSAINFYKNNLSKAARRCSELEGDSKRLCMIKVKIAEKTKLVHDLRASMTLLNREPDPEKRKKYIDKVKEKIKDINEEIKKLRYQSNTILQRKK